jgi:hypothetical protein
MPVSLELSRVHFFDSADASLVMAKTAVLHTYARFASELMEPLVNLNIGILEEHYRLFAMLLKLNEAIIPLGTVPFPP